MPDLTPVEKIDYFVSDLHLGASYFMDPREHEKRVCEWLRSIVPTARRLFLLGDILDYWFEYKYVIPRGFVRFFGTLAELSDSGVEVTWIIGNHDIWIFDYLPSELGIKVVDGVLDTTLDGHRFIMAHGDGLGPIPTKERLMRAIFRNRICQRLFASVHPRWTVGVAYGWSAHNRRKHHTGPTARQLPIGPLEKWVDTHIGSTDKSAHPVDFYVFGHYHTMVNKLIGNSHLIVLGDWITNMSFGTFDGQKFRLHRVKGSEKW